MLCWGEKMQKSSPSMNIALTGYDYRSIISNTSSKRLKKHIDEWLKLRFWTWRSSLDRDSLSKLGQCLGVNDDKEKSQILYIALSIDVVFNLHRHTECETS